MSAANIKFNFGAISPLDDSVFGSHRPGFLPNEENEKPGAVDDALVADWCSFIKSQVCENNRADALEQLSSVLPRPA